MTHIEKHTKKLIFFVLVVTVSYILNYW